MVRRWRGKNTGIRGLFYTYAIFIFSIRLGGEVLSLGFWLHFEASPVSRTSLACRRQFLRPLEARRSASRQSLAWMYWSPYALGTQPQLWFWHGCTGHCMLPIQTKLWFWQGCSGHRLLLEPERKYGFGMDALVTICSWNPNEIMFLARMLWSPYALEPERNCSLGMDALVAVCSWDPNENSRALHP